MMRQQQKGERESWDNGTYITLTIIDTSIHNDANKDKRIK
jgi:hypothetical protein